MATYSMDFRERVAAARDEGMETAEVAELFGCCRSWVRRLMQRRRELGTLEPLKRKAAAAAADRRALKDADLEQLRRLLAERPDMTLGELATALGHKASEPTLSRALTRLGLPRKKSPSVPRSGTART
jgi:transposase